MQYDSDAVVAADIAVTPAASGAAKCSRQGGLDFSVDVNPFGYDASHPIRAVSVSPAYGVAIEEDIAVNPEASGAAKFSRQGGPDFSVEANPVMLLIPVVLYLRAVPMPLLLMRLILLRLTLPWILKHLAPQSALDKGV